MNKMIFLSALIMIMANPVSAEAKKSGSKKYQLKAYSESSEDLRRNKLEEEKVETKREVASEEAAVSEEQVTSEDGSARDIASMRPMIDDGESQEIVAQRNMDIKKEQRQETRRGMKTIHIERTFLQNERIKY